MKQITFIILMFTVNLCAAQQEKTFSEEQFLAVVKKYHPVVKQALIDVQIANAEVRIARGQFDPVISSGNARKELDGTSYYDQRQTQIKIPTWYGIDIVAGQENISGSRVNPESTKGHLNYIGFSVPLVQNLVIDKRRAALQQAKIFKDLSDVQRKAVVNDLLSDAMKVYWEWWEQYHIHQLMQNTLGVAAQRLHMVKVAFQLGDRPAIDTLEAFTQVQLLSVKQAENFAELIKSQMQLSTYLWAEKEQQYDLPMDVLPQQWELNNELILDDILKASVRHPDLVQYSYKLDILEVGKQLKFQSLLPQVHLKYNQIGSDISKTASAAWFQNNYRYGVSFSMPLRLSEGRGEYQKARLKIDHTRLEQVNKQAQIQNKVKQYFTDWQQSNVQLNMQDKLVNNVSALQRGEETRFANGESSLFLINAREQRTIEARQKLIELKSKNRKALVSLQWSAGMFGQD